MKEKKIHITGSDVNHIKNVLRMRQGETILISAGDNLEYTCLVSEMEAEEVIADISYVQEVGMELPSKIYLFQGLPKSDKMEMIIQKAVELGVYEVIPVSTARAVVKLDAKKEASKQKRWQTIAESAAKQSKRMVIPEIHSVMKFSEAVNYAEERISGSFRMNLLKIWHTRKNCLNRSNRGSLSVSLSDRKVDSHRKRSNWR